MEISPHIKEVKQALTDKLGIGVTFDVILREITVGEKDALFVFVDGFIKAQVTQYIIENLQELDRSDLGPNVIKKLLRRVIPYFEVETTSDFDKAMDAMLTGPALLFIDGVKEAIVLDVREYPVRSIQEPDLERVTRGSREGFVETIIFNTALVRRRVRDPGLRFEAFQVGQRSKTDVIVGYINDVVNPRLVAKIKERIQRVDTDALTMGVKSLEEWIMGTKINPLPTVRYTERPDVAAAHMYEGYVVVMADTTPTAMILPATMWQFTQHAEEYFQNPVVGTYLRWIRFLGIGMSLLLTPVWLSLFLSKGMLPDSLQFLGPKDAATTPIWLQFFILEFGLDLLRMALIHTPGALATSLGIVGAILLGNLAVDVGLFNPVTILYTAVVAIGYFATPSIEFGLALRLFRLFLLIMAALFKIPGVIIGFVLVVTLMVFTRSLGQPYLYPLIPFNGPSLARLLFRLPIPTVSRRPDHISGKDKDTRNKS